MLVRITPDDGAVAADLYEWLRADRIDGVLAEATDPETLGALEIVNVVLSQAAAFSSLAVAIASWRQSRAPEPRITITKSDGSTLELPSGPGGSADVVLAFLTAPVPPAGGDGGGSAPDRR